jgi:hypothetical protein
MDWALAIERNRLPLLRIVAVLCGMIGLGRSATVGRVARPLHRQVLALLRPAEAAVRRLIVVVARGLVVTPRPPRAAPAGLVIPRRGQGRLSFQLFDPVRVLPERHGRCDARAGCEPRIRAIDVRFGSLVPLFRLAPVAAPDQSGRLEDHTVDAGPLGRRLAAIRLALEDLPRQARRYARWQARPLETRRPRRLTALRSGPPPGLCRRSTHEVDEILAQCHWLARHAAASDTS